MKIVFMGTPDFSVGALRALYEAGHEIIGVVTQPDKPKGRGKNLAFTPVKEEALRLSFRFISPGGCGSRSLFRCCGNLRRM